MNRSISLIIAAVAFLSLCSGTFCTTTRFLGSVVYPKSVRKLSEFKILYKGDEYPVEEPSESGGIPAKGYFELYEDKNCMELYVLVTARLKMPQNSDIEYFKTHPSYPYKLFKLTRDIITKTVGEKTERVVTWHIEDLDNSSSIIQVPQHAIVFLLPASFVAGLEAEEWDEDEYVVRLPKLVLKNSLSEQELNDAVTKMMFTLLDFKPFHSRHPEQVMQVASNRIVSMPYHTVATSV